MHKYEITARNLVTGNTTTFQVRADSEPESRERARVAEGWAIEEVLCLTEWVPG